MKNITKIGLSVVAGLATAAATYLIKTEKGSEIRENMSVAMKKALENGQKYSKQLAEAAQVKAKQASEKMNKVIEPELEQPKSTNGVLN